MPRVLSCSILLVLACASVWTQALPAAKVPTVVAVAMRDKFPAVKAVEWKLKTDKNYEAEFVMKGIEYTVKFDASGKWLESEYAIARSAVPKAVLEATAAKFKSYKITEMQQLERWNDASPVYELHVENAREIVKLQFAADATVLSQSSKPQPGKAK